MEMDKRLQELSDVLKNYDWFSEVGLDQFGRPVVYVKFMNDEQIQSIPNTIFGKQVLVHLADAKTVSANKYITFYDNKINHLNNEPSFLDEDIYRLNKAIKELTMACNSEIIQTIFFELHDGKNAVTNLSSRYRSVRYSLEKLYDEFGFDVLYDAL